MLTSAQTQLDIVQVIQERKNALQSLASQLFRMGSEFLNISSSKTIDGPTAHGTCVSRYGIIWEQSCLPRGQARFLRKFRL